MTPQCLASAVVLTSLLFSSAALEGQAFPKGTFAATIRGDKWTISFDDKGKFKFMRKSELVVEGTYKVVKDQIELDDAKKANEEHHPKPGKYTWKLEDKKLTFKMVEDESKSRAKALTSQPWVKE